MLLHWNTLLVLEQVFCLLTEQPATVNTLISWQIVWMEDEQHHQCEKVLHEYAKV